MASRFLNKFVIPRFLKDHAYQKILRGAFDATPGDRAWPKRNHLVDREIGLRWDWGEKMILTEGRLVRNLVLQANKGAAQEALKRSAGRNSHAKLAVVQLDLKHPQSEDKFLEEWRAGFEEFFRGGK